MLSMLKLEQMINIDMSLLLVYSYGMDFCKSINYVLPGQCLKEGSHRKEEETIICKNKNMRTQIRILA